MSKVLYITRTAAVESRIMAKLPCSDAFFFSNVGRMMMDYYIVLQMAFYGVAANYYENEGSK